MRSLPFLLREALINLRRHGLMTAASISTLAVSLALVGGFALTFYQINAGARRALGAFEMRVFCRQNIAKTTLPVVQRRIEALRGVESVVYLSKEEAFAEQVRALPIDATGIPNQMNETFVVKTIDVGGAGPLAREIRSWHADIESVDMADTEMRNALVLAHFVRDAGLMGAVLLVLGTLVVVSNTIRLSVVGRRREIKIMQLVGATPAFIRFPLLLEGVIQGAAGGALAGLTLLALGRYVGGLIRATIPLLVPYGAPIDLVRCGLALVAAGALLGAGGALLSLRRHLRA